ncbi:MAG: ABC transporter ATP-binding protein [Eubacterium sp.]|nr:ABC transporter ATP-binding protein [Eubacterium sp.]
MDKDTAILVDHVSKLYKLYDKPFDRMKEALGFSRKKLYTEHYALHDLSFEVKKGDCIGIIGTNGAGKSTILKIITGVINPTEGTAQTDGHISALLELGAGFNMEYTGLQNVYINGAMMGFSHEDIDKKLDAILEFADIGDYVNQPVKTYSSGMFVRLAFAVAINIDPEILIVDEALSVGDVFFQAKCFKKFQEFKDEGKTILFVSHDLSSIRKYCDRAILLNKGRKLGEGRPADMIDLYKKVLVGQVDEEGVSDDNPPADTGLWKSNIPLNPNVSEYGDGQVRITDFAVLDNQGVYSTTLLKGEEFAIKIKIRAEEAVENPIVAFTVKTVRGTDVTGTNTMFENNDIGPMRAGEERTVTFRQDMSLQGGQYLISLGCTRFENDGFQVYHRLYDVLTLSVVSEKNTTGFYDMNSRVTVE